MRVQFLFPLLMAAEPAAAHVVFSPPTVAPGAEYVGALKVGHGCSGSPTVALKVEVPRGVVAAVTPKPGWRIAVVRAVSLGGGKTPPIRTVTWRGRLAADAADTFPIAFQAPSVEGPLYFPVIQTCETGEVRWTGIPAASQSLRELKFPAPVLRVKAAIGPEGAAVAPEVPNEVKVVDGALRSASGLPLYTFNFDTMVGMSHCFGECVAKRPPLLAPANAKGDGDWTVIERGDDTRQWAYKTKPLYTFTGDTPGGPPTGVGPGSNWSVARY